jgi:hypothetical protein
MSVGGPALVATNRVEYAQRGKEEKEREQVRMSLSVCPPTILRLTPARGPTARHGLRG